MHCFVHRTQLLTSKIYMHPPTPTCVGFFLILTQAVLYTHDHVHMYLNTATQMQANHISSVDTFYWKKNYRKGCLYNIILYQSDWFQARTTPTISYTVYNENAVAGQSKSTCLLASSPLAAFHEKKKKMSETMKIMSRQKWHEATYPPHCMCTEFTLEFCEDVGGGWVGVILEELLTTPKLLCPTYLKIKGFCSLKAFKFKCLKYTGENTHVYIILHTQVHVGPNK